MRFLQMQVKGVFQSYGQTSFQAFQLGAFFKIIFMSFYIGNFMQTIQKILCNTVSLSFGCHFLAVCPPQSDTFTFMIIVPVLKIECIFYFENMTASFVSTLFLGRYHYIDSSLKFMFFVTITKGDEKLQKRETHT